MNPYTVIKKQLLVFISIILLGQGCVEHLFFISVSSNGDYTFQYNGKGDLEDLTNSDFSVPRSNGWNIISNFVEHENSYIFSSQKKFEKNERFPDSFFDSDTIPYYSLLKHPTDIGMDNYFIFTRFHFNCIFKNREVTSRYPKLGEFILNPDNPPEGWIKESFSSLLNMTLDAVNPGFNKYPILKNELTSWLNGNIMILSDSILFVNMDYYRKEGLKILKDGTPSTEGKIDSIFYKFESEAKITLDLMDDQFKYQVSIPGKLNSFNADSLSGDTLFWEFNLQNFMDTDVVMTANSYIFYRGRLLFCLIFVTLIIVFYRNRGLNK